MTDDTTGQHPAPQSDALAARERVWEVEAVLDSARDGLEAILVCLPHIKDGSLHIPSVQADPESVANLIAHIKRVLG